MIKAIVRPLRVDDAEGVAELSEMLGYPVHANAVRSRIEGFASSSEHAAFAATVQDVVVGWIDAAVERHLQSEPAVVIGGLVVRDDMRGRRIGQQLCQAVEEWAVQIGVSTVRVRSQQKRADAHRFYLRDGYEQVKVSAVFEKQ